MSVIKSLTNGTVRRQSRYFDLSRAGHSKMRAQIKLMQSSAPPLKGTAKLPIDIRNDPHGQTIPNQLIN